MGQPSPPRNNPLGHGSGRSSDRRMGTRSSPNGNHPPLARQTAFIEVVLRTSRELTCLSSTKLCDKTTYNQTLLKARILKPLLRTPWLGPAHCRCLGRCHPAPAPTAM